MVDELECEVRSGIHVMRGEGGLWSVEEEGQVRHFPLILRIDEGQKAPVVGSHLELFRIQLIVMGRQSDELIPVNLPLHEGIGVLVMRSVF